jgi:hypothetical protein
VRSHCGRHPEANGGHRARTTKGSRARAHALEGYAVRLVSATCPSVSPRDLPLERRKAREGHRLRRSSTTSIRAFAPWTELIGRVTQDAAYVSSGPDCDRLGPLASPGGARMEPYVESQASRAEVRPRSLEECERKWNRITTIQASRPPGEGLPPWTRRGNARSHPEAVERRTRRERRTSLLPTKRAKLAAKVVRA